MKLFALISVSLLVWSSLARADELLSAQDRMTFALLTSVADIVAARADASSCYELQGQYPITLFATGVSGGRIQDNMVTFDLQNRMGYVMGFPYQAIPEVGTTIQTMFFLPASLIGTTDTLLRIKEYKGRYVYDSTNELLTMTSNVSLLTPITLSELKYRATEITNFSPDSTNSLEGTNISNDGWGMNALMNSDFPRSKYWKRFKISRDEGVNARAVLVSDILSDGQSCRVEIDMNGHNGSDYINQNGYLTIDLSEPHDPVNFSFN